jgi:hypothetical protein
MDNFAKKLESMGFVRSGEWKLEGTQIKYVLHRNQDACNVLYSFMISGAVVYIGKTVQSLSRRMYGYQNPAPTQSTNIKGNQRIAEELQNGKIVEIHALPDNGLLYYGGFHVNLAAGLEDSLIRGIKPAWNVSGR